MNHRPFSPALPALLCLAALAAPLSARADESEGPRIRALAGVLVTAGEGSKLFIAHPDGAGSEVDLGGVLDLYAGAEFPLAPNGLALQLTAGVHQSASSNGESARRYPLEAILMYPMSNNVRLGGGIRYPAHLTFSGPVSSGSGGAAGVSSTPGFLGTIEIRLTEHLALDFRYVEEQYEYTTSKGSLNASHFGAGVSAMF
jgi:hypothetical protein